MIGKSLTIDKSLLLVVTLARAGLSHADTIDNHGQAPYEQCGYCHEYDGNSRMPSFPRLAGQHADYLLKQLQDFSAGRRQGVMQATAELLSNQDMHVVATYFSGQQARPARLRPLSAAAKQRAQQLFLKGDRARALPACISCHDRAGQGNSRTPRLSGQHQAYLEGQLTAFKNGQRRNDQDAQMRHIAARLTRTEISQLAAFLARQTPSELSGVSRHPDNL